MSLRTPVGALLWLLVSSLTLAVEPTPATHESPGVTMEGTIRPIEETDDHLTELVVALDKPSAFLDSARESFGEALSGISGAHKASPQSKVSKAGRFVLWGDLFKTGGCFALAELAPQGDQGSDPYGVAFAEWLDGRWELRGLWQIPTVWRPRWWEANGDDPLPAKPASQPFELRDLSGDGVPELIVAGEVEKYFQENYLLCFARETHGLRLVGSAMGRPEARGKYVRLYFNSGRRAIYEEWRFLTWKGDRLIPVASWHEEVGYGSNDPTFSEGERTGPDGKSTIIRVSYGTGQEIDADFYELTRDGKPFGRMRITWRADQKIDSLNIDGIEKAWLFEKITGLPRRLYPSSERASSLRRLELLASVTIEDSVEAEKLFSAETK